MSVGMYSTWKYKMGVSALRERWLGDDKLGIVMVMVGVAMRRERGEGSVVYDDAWAWGTVRLWSRKRCW